jgi:hypothetical protein
MYDRAGVAATVRTLAVHHGSSAMTSAAGPEAEADRPDGAHADSDATDAVTSGRGRNAVEAFRETGRTL